MKKVSTEEFTPAIFFRNFLQVRQV